MLNLRDFNIKTLWVRLWFSFFITYLLCHTDTSIGIYFREYQSWMEVGLFLLSFPMNICAVFIAAYLFDTGVLCIGDCWTTSEALYCDSVTPLPPALTRGGCWLTSEAFYWLCAHAAGFLQCEVISRMFRPLRITKLNLNGTGKIAATVTPRAPLSVIAATSVLAHTGRELKASLNR